MLRSILRQPVRRLSKHQEFYHFEQEGRKQYKGTDPTIEARKEDVFHELNYLWNEQTKRSENHLGSQILEEWFDHLDTSDETKEPVSRYENRSINVFGLMQIKPRISTNRRKEKQRCSSFCGSYFGRNKFTILGLSSS